MGDSVIGHEGYLVGGSVRDLLVDSRPKDFDIVTTATPVQVIYHHAACEIPLPHSIQAML